MSLTFFNLILQMTVLSSQVSRSRILLPVRSGGCSLKHTEEQNETDGTRPTHQVMSQTLEGDLKAAGASVGRFLYSYYMSYIYKQSWKQHMMNSWLLKHQYMWTVDWEVPTCTTKRLLVRLWFGRR